MLSFFQVFATSVAFFVCVSCYSQILVTPGDIAPYTPTNIIESIFLGDGVDVTGISYEGDPRALGVFSNANFGVRSGIIMSTGFAMSAQLPNDNTIYSGNSTIGREVTDLDLEQAAGVSVLDIAKYEISFIPTSDTIRFRYVFASEEYPEFVCDENNDVFGFFIRGPNPEGGFYDMENIALVPDPNDPSGDTFLDMPVTINTVNGGQPAPYTDVANCQDPIGSLSFSDFYNETADGDFPVYDGYLDVFTAVANVIPCEEYTIKLAIGDGVDGDFDSAVFLEANSFGSSALSYDITTASFDRTISEGCKTAFLDINLGRRAQEDTPIELRILTGPEFENLATEDTDYFGITENPVIPTGARNVRFEIEAVEDFMTEDLEFIYLELRVSPCRLDTLVFPVTDRQLPNYSIPDTITYCEGMTTMSDIMAQSDRNPPVLEAPIFSNRNRINFQSEPQSYMSLINVDGLDPNDQSTRLLNRICIDRLVTRNLEDIDLHVIDPNGIVLELSTDNGVYPTPNECLGEVVNATCLDTMNNLCFRVNAAMRDISGGSPIEGPILDGSRNYVGDYEPEGDFNSIYTPGNVNNGTWGLIIRVDEPQSETDISNGWSFFDGWTLRFHSVYSVGFEWTDNMGNEFNVFDETLVGEAPEVPTTYYFTVTDTYDCFDVDSTVVIPSPIPAPPTNLICSEVTPSSVSITWTPSPDESVTYNVTMNGNFLLGGLTETTFERTLLEENTNYTFRINAQLNNCESESVFVTCRTPVCTGPRPIIDTLIVSPESCDGFSDAGLEIVANDPSSETLTYVVDAFAKDNGTFVGLSSGPHLIRVINDAGCVTRDSVNIEEGEKLDLEINTVDNNCMNDFNGRIEIIPAENLYPYFINIAQIEELDGEILNFTDCALYNEGESCIYENLASNTYLLTVIGSGSDCFFREPIVIGSSPEFRISEIDYEVSGCISRPADVRINVTGGSPPYEYYWEGIENGPLIPNVLEGQYELTILDNSGCRIDSLVQLDGLKEISLEQDTFRTICGDGTPGIISLDITGGNGGYSVAWSNGMNGITVDSIVFGDYSVTITDSENCINTFDVAVRGIMDIEEIELEVDVMGPECFNAAEGIAIFDLNGGMPPFSIFLDSIVNQSDYIFDSLLPGIYEVTVADAIGCTFSFPEIEIPNQEETYVDLGMDTVVMFGSNIDIEISSNVSITNLEWSVSLENGPILSCLDCENLNISDIQTNFTLNLLATDTRGCVLESQKNFFVDDETFVEVPTAFTPDGNGVNDKLVVFGFPNTEIIEFRIIDRWGETLYIDQNFITNDLSRGWDGSFKGKLEEPGTYLWSATFRLLNGQETDSSGSVTLIR